MTDRTDNARAVREAAISLYRAMRRANPDAWAEVDEVEDWAYWDDIVRTAQVTESAVRARIAADIREARPEIGLGVLVTDRRTALRDGMDRAARIAEGGTR